MTKQCTNCILADRVITDLKNTLRKYDFLAEILLVELSIIHSLRGCFYILLS